MTLVGLLVGMAVASILACVVVGALARTGAALQRHRQQTGVTDDAWTALDAIVGDIDAGADWRFCTEARHCAARPGEERIRHAGYRASMLVTARAEWLVEGGLRRCAPGCVTYLDNVTSMSLVADVKQEDGSVRRMPYLQFHGTRPDIVEVTLTMHGGKRFSRVVRRRPMTETPSTEDAVTMSAPAR